MSIDDENSFSEDRPVINQFHAQLLSVIDAEPVVVRHGDRGSGLELEPLFYVPGGCEVE